MSEYSDINYSQVLEDYVSLRYDLDQEDEDNLRFIARSSGTLSKEEFWDKKTEIDQVLSE